MLASLLPLGVILAMTVTAFAFILIVVKHPKGGLSSLSRYISSHKNLFVKMGILLTITGTIFFGFLYFWLQPRYHLDSFIDYIIIFSYVAFLGLAWIPDINTRDDALSLHIIHFACGGLTAIGVVSVLVFCLFSNLVTPLAYAASLMAVIFCTTTIILFFAVTIVNRNFFKFEIACITTMFIAVTCLALLI